MRCQRCRGLMVEDHFLDMQESFGRPWMKGWRCPSCGDIVDPVIQRHRLMQAARPQQSDQSDEAPRDHAPVTA